MAGESPLTAPVDYRAAMISPIGSAPSPNSAFAARGDAGKVVVNFNPNLNPRLNPLLMPSRTQALVEIEAGLNQTRALQHFMYDRLER